MGFLQLIRLAWSLGRFFIGAGSKALLHALLLTSRLNITAIEGRPVQAIDPAHTKWKRTQ